MPKRRSNIPIFIPHLGCPNNCVFCNQRTISGHQSFDEKDVPRQIEEALATIEARGEIEYTEIAFFGGSFTGIERGLMLSLLEVAHSYIESGRVQGIRLSTRPDYIDEEILLILSKYGVMDIELGLQSMSDKVLKASKRGHDRACAERACRMVKEHGFSLVGQMMIGLPGATPNDEIETAERICALGADATRVYPTVVFYGTELCEMAQNNLYKPLTDSEAVERTKEVLRVFDAHGVNCIRVGLCASENLASKEAVYGGANHSAIGELAMGELFYEKISEALETLPEGENSLNVIIYVPKGATSKAVGQRRINIIRLKNKYFAKKRIKMLKILEKNELLGYNIGMDFCVT